MTIIYHFKLLKIHYHEEQLEFMKHQNRLIEQQTELIKAFKIQLGNKQ
ncbi:MAG: hypothetical protein ACXVJI_16545 [Mucilaginibacter sp.]